MFTLGCMIYLAPLQGFTDFIYRKAHFLVFSGIDKYFIPYITVKNDAVSRKHVQEIWPENNPKSNVIPQVLAKNSSELLFLSEYLSSYGYHEINLNLGCPYPMVTKKGRGAGLLPFPEKIENMLADFYKIYDIKLSVKIRAGLENTFEINKILPVFNQFPLEEIIFHPRTAKQLYKGEIAENAFVWTSKNTKIPLVYNGDIFSINDYLWKNKKLQTTQKWMLGRGILKNLFLPNEIKNEYVSRILKQEQLEKFHELVFEGYSTHLDNAGNVLNKMKQFWKYFSYNFKNQKIALKTIKKIRNPKLYRAQVKSIFSANELI